MRKDGVCGTGLLCNVSGCPVAGIPAETFLLQVIKYGYQFKLIAECETGF